MKILIATLLAVALVYGSELSCEDLTGCATCAQSKECWWCGTYNSGSCHDINDLTNNFTCPQSLCNGDSCNDVCVKPCTKGLFPCSDNYIGQLMLIAGYGLILGYGAKVLSDGSELLLELFPKWGTVIGALLLPVLGAVPDAAIILVSGAFGTKDEAQSQVAVGVGTLAGSTIMLLTVPWAASMHVARCDMEVGEAIDGKCTGFSVVRQGISVDRDTPTNAKIMVLTSISYFIVQGIAFAYVYDPKSVSAHKWESPFALAGFIVCFVCLICYCIYQVFVPKLAEKRNEKIEKERQERFLKLRALHILTKWVTPQPALPDSPKPVVTEDHTHAKTLHLGLKWKKKALGNKSEESPLIEKPSVNAVDLEKEVEEEEKEEDPRQHFGKNLFKAILLIAVATAVVAVFSDPMVEVLSDLSGKLKINPFFVSFLVTPYCSNASELISSLMFARKKKKENASLVYSQLYGAATMNNTLCLGIFFALIYFRRLAWAFTAETLSILLVTWIVGAIGAFRQHFRYYVAFPIILLYPLSLAFVYFLESVVHWA